MLDVGLEASPVVEPSTAIASPIPPIVILAISVVFLPRFRGTLP
jgi:hypothetical protein